MLLIELARQINLNPIQVAHTNGGEHASPCPICGGDDRFRIWPRAQQKNCTGRYWCRKCEISGDTIQFAMDFLHMRYPEAYEHVTGTAPKLHENYAQRSAQPIRRQQPPTLHSPPSAWQMKSTAFAQWGYEQLLQRPDIIAHLEHRGVPRPSVEKYKIGLCPRDIYQSREDWGLPEELNSDGIPKKMWLSQGIIVPYFDNNQVVRLTIRRIDWQPGDKYGKYIKIPGGINGYSIIGNTNNQIMAIVETELDGYALDDKVGDILFVAAIGGCMANPDNLSHHLITHTQHVLIMHDRDEAGLNMLNKLKAAYPHAQACPVPFGKDIGEAREQGLNLRDWFLRELLQRSPWQENDRELITYFYDYMRRTRKEYPHSPLMEIYEKMEREIAMGPQQPIAQLNLLRARLQDLRIRTTPVIEIQEAL